jgi:hypothetical protein
VAKKPNPLHDHPTSGTTPEQNESPAAANADSAPSWVTTQAAERKAMTTRHAGERSKLNAQHEADHKEMAAKHQDEAAAATADTTFAPAPPKSPVGGDASFSRGR